MKLTVQLTAPLPHRAHDTPLYLVSQFDPELDGGLVQSTDFVYLTNIFRIAGGCHILDRVHPAVLINLKDAAGNSSRVTLVFDPDLATEIYVRDLQASAGNNADTTSMDQPKVGLLH